MSVRTMKIWLVAAVILLAAVPVWADQWPDRGFFFVRSKMSQKGRKVCLLELSLSVEQKLFALAWVENEDGDPPLIVNYMSADPRITLAERVVVQIDGAEVVAFTPVSRSVEPEITTLAGLVRGEDASRVWQAMQQASAKAAWLTVEAGKTSMRVPATGLRDALADFAECRRQRSL